MAENIKIENEISEENGEAPAIQEDGKEKHLLLLEKSLKEKEEEAAKYLDHLQRLQAEFQNYKKRSAEERKKIEEVGKEDLIKNLLPVIDSMEKSLNHTGKDLDRKVIVKGIELVHKQLKNLLKKERITRIESVGEKFDPLLHEAVMTEFSDEHSPGIILEELEPGYSFNGRILRPTKVKVAISKEQG